MDLWPPRLRRPVRPRLRWRRRSCRQLPTDFHARRERNHGVIWAFPERTAYRMNGWQVENVESHRGDLRQLPFHIAECAVLPGNRRGGAGKYSYQEEQRARSPDHRSGDSGSQPVACSRSGNGPSGHGRRHRMDTRRTADPDRPTGRGNGPPHARRLESAPAGSSIAACRIRIAPVRSAGYLLRGATPASGRLAWICAASRFLRSLAQVSKWSNPTQDGEAPRAQFLHLKEPVQRSFTPGLIGEKRHRRSDLWRYSRRAAGWSCPSAKTAAVTTTSSPTTRHAGWRPASISGSDLFNDDATASIRRLHQVHLPPANLDMASLTGLKGRAGCSLRLKRVSLLGAIWMEMQERSGRLTGAPKRRFWAAPRAEPAQRAR